MERTRNLLELFGNPDKKLKIIQIAGSNGKGSIAAYLTNILIASGYKTGTFTSPEVYAYSEKFLFDGKPAEEFIKYCISYALENAREDIQFLNDMYDNGLIERLENVVKQDFVRLPYTEGVKILEESGKKFEFPVYWGADLQSEHERYLVEEHFKCPVILTDYPKEIKAFYMKQNEDGKTVRAMDVLFPKIGEIIGGSEREENYDKLLHTKS